MYLKLAISLDDVLRWLPAEQWISYRMASLVWLCLLDLAIVYLRELCCPLLSAMSSRLLLSSQQGLILVSLSRTSTEQTRAFSVIGLSTLKLRIFPKALSSANFSNLKTAPLAVLDLGAPLSSFIEETQYKCSI